MTTGYRRLNFPVLTSALVAPASTPSKATAQDDKRHEGNGLNVITQTRVCSRTHKQHNNWSGGAADTTLGGA
jgi:hypothetical protein